MAQDTTSSPTETIGALDNYVLLGHSGLRVSPLCLGTMTFGEKWGLGSNKEESKKVFDYYYEQGGNFFDTACNYNHGDSERFLGDYVADKRSSVVIATKYTARNDGDPGTYTNSNKTRVNPNSGGNHRKNLVETLDASLKRLNMSYVDMLYVHFFDYRTPIVEIMRSLDDVVRSGKSLYVALSDTPAWALARANTIAELRGWSPFIGLQTRYNLMDRSLEFDLQPACAELDVGIVPWGCVAEGFLTGKYTRESVSDPKLGLRNNSIERHAKKEENWKILDEVIAVSKEINRTPAQVSLNWLKQKPGITSPIIGSRTVTQLEENIKSLEFKLTPQQMERLDEVSCPTEIPFPYTVNVLHDRFLAPNVEIPKKFQPIAGIRQPDA